MPNRRGTFLIYPSQLQPPSSYSSSTAGTPEYLETFGYSGGHNMTTWEIVAFERDLEETFKPRPVPDQPA